jgi:hypothetical protein
MTPDPRLERWRPEIFRRHYGLLGHLRALRQPNAEGLPDGRPASPTPQVMLFGPQMKSGDLPNKRQLDFFKER